MRFIQTEPEDTSIDLTPLVDVVFQLIIYFAVATTFAFLGAMKVNLPKAGTATELTPSQRKIMIAIEETGAIYLEDQLVSFPDLKNQLKNFAKDKSDSLIVIQADKNTKHGIVVSVLDLVKSIGFERVAIATEALPAGTNEESER